MANTLPKVMALVEAELKKNPDASVQELYDKARRVSRSISSMSLRQFHARYPLQIKRKKGPARRRSAVRASRTARKSTRRGFGRYGPERDAVRGVLLKFASDLAAAEQRKDAVKVVADVDGYVDDVLAAVSKA